MIENCYITEDFPVRDPVGSTWIKTGESRSVVDSPWLAGEPQSSFLLIPLRRVGVKIERTKVREIMG